MPFYKHKLKAGHAGRSQYNILVIYNYAETLLQATKNARHYPMVKHTNATTIQASREVNEIEFVIGIVQNAYAKLKGNYDEIITKLTTIDKILSRVCNYEFQTEEGKTLVGFRNTYNNASAKVKPMVEKEYQQWAQNLVEKYTDDQVFGF